MLTAEEMSTTEKAGLLTRFYGYSSDEVDGMNLDELNEAVTEVISEFDPSSIDDFDERYNDEEDEVSLYEILCDEEDRNDLGLLFPNADYEELEDELEGCLK